MSKSFMKHSKITQRVSYIKLYWDFVEDFSGVYGTNDEILRGKVTSFE